MPSDAVASDKERKQRHLKSCKNPGNYQTPPLVRDCVAEIDSSESKSSRTAKGSECVLIIGAGTDLGEAVTRSCLEKGFHVKALLTREDSVVRFCEQVRSSIVNVPTTGLRGKSVPARGRVAPMTKELFQVMEPSSLPLLRPEMKEPESEVAEKVKEESSLPFVAKERLQIFWGDNRGTPRFRQPWFSYLDQFSSPASLRIFLASSSGSPRNIYDLTQPSRLPGLFMGSSVCAVVDCTLSDPNFGGVLPEGADRLAVTCGLDRYWRGKVSLLEAAKVSGARGWVSFLPYRKKLWLTSDTTCSLVEDAFGLEVSSTGLNHVVFQLPRLFESACRWFLWSQYLLGFLSSGVGYLAYRVDSLRAWDVFVSGKAVSESASSLSAELAVFTASHGSLPDVAQYRHNTILSGCINGRLLLMNIGTLLDQTAERLRRARDEEDQGPNSPKAFFPALLPFVEGYKGHPGVIFRRCIQSGLRSLRELDPAEYSANRVVSSCPGTGASWEFLSVSHRYDDDGLPEAYPPRADGATLQVGRSSPETLLDGARDLWKTISRRFVVFSRALTVVVAAPGALPPLYKVLNYGTKLRRDLASVLRRAYVTSRENVYERPYLSYFGKAPKSVELLSGYVFLFSRLFSDKNRKPSQESEHVAPKVTEDWISALLGSSVFQEVQTSVSGPYEAFARRRESGFKYPMECVRIFDYTKDPSGDTGGLTESPVGSFPCGWRLSPRSAEEKVKKCRNLLYEAFAKRRESEFKYLMDLSRRKGVFKKLFVGTFPYYRLIELMANEETVSRLAQKAPPRYATPGPSGNSKAVTPLNRRAINDWEFLCVSLYIFGSCLQGKGKTRRAREERGSLKKVGDRFWFYGASFMPSWFGQGLWFPPFSPYVGVYGGFYDVVVFVLGLFEGWSFVEELFGLRLREKSRAV